MKSIITHPDKIFWPKSHSTKGDVANYYKKFFPYIQPYLLNRPVTLHMYPNGVSQESYYIRNIPDYAPSWIKTLRYIPKTVDHPDFLPTITTLNSLEWFVNLGCIEFHVWNSHAPKLKTPDSVILDLDAGEKTEFSQLLECAIYIHDILKQKHIRAYIKTSGGKGVHIYIPIQTIYRFSQTKKFAKEIASEVTTKHGNFIRFQEGKQHQEGYVSIDIGQNNIGRNTAAPYSLRANQNMPLVSTPLTWEEVQEGKILPTDFTIEAVSIRMQTRKDPFLGFLNTHNIIL